MKKQKIETVKNLLRHRHQEGEYILDLTERKYYFEPTPGNRKEITEQQFKDRTAPDKRIKFNLIDAKPCTQ